jgi:hypothetical protein
MRPDDLCKQALGQVGVGQLQDEVPGVSDEAPAGLEQCLLQTEAVLNIWSAGLRAAGRATMGTVPKDP